MVNVYPYVAEGEQYVDEREWDGLYKYYQLHIDAISLLPLNQELIVNLDSGHMVLIDWHRRMLLDDRHFSRKEAAITLALLNAWPSYLPLEKMLPLAMPAEDPDLVRLWLNRGTPRIRAKIVSIQMGYAVAAMTVDLIE
jgi:hypothetical protein